MQYNAAWTLEHKLMPVTKERDSRIRLTERMEIDDVYLSGERAGVPGKAGREAPGKTPFVAAVETEHDGKKPKRIVLQVVAGFTGAEIAEFQYRCNRRVDLAATLPRLAYVSLRTPPMPYELLKLPEPNA